MVLSDFWRKASNITYTADMYEYLYELCIHTIKKRREAPAAAADDPARTREEGPVALKVGDAVTFAFPGTSANAPLSGKRGVVEALPGGGDFPDRYVVFVAATAYSGQRRLAVKRERLEFFARGL